MKVLVSWLKEFVDFDLDADALADGLTMQGTEAEFVTPLDKLIGENAAAACILGEPEEIDEGRVRFPVEVEGKETVALTHAPHIPKGFTVLVQQGNKEFVIPTLAELELNELKFPLVIPEGMDLDDVRADAVIEFETLSNRGDLLSHLGIAREISILAGNPLREPEVFREFGETDEDSARPIELADPALCPRYVGMSFSGVEIAHSPDWMWYRLSNLGVNPIINLVDLTNYVLLELGQPLHAFDPRFLKGGIVVRRAEPGEKFTAINHVEYELGPDYLMIADEVKAVAIAGVMGGIESEIKDDTGELFLESAYFAPVNIRKTSKRLGLMSDSSLRFGRGVDPQGAVRGALRFARLLDEIGAGSFVPGSFRDVDRRREEMPAITFPLKKVKGLLGVEIKDERIIGLLESAGFSAAGNPPVVTVTPPSWRGDLEIPADLVEEVLRLYSYTKVEPSMPLLPLGVGRFEDSFVWESRVRDVLRGMGLYEARTYTLQNPSVIRRWLGKEAPEGGQAYRDVLEDVVFLDNPDSSEMSALRPTLASGLVEVLTTNRRKHSEALPVLYEVGRVFARGEVKGHSAYWFEREDNKYSETRSLGILLGEDMTTPPAPGADFGALSVLYSLKGILRRLFSELGFTASFEDAGKLMSPWYEPGKALKVKANGTDVGQAGLLNASLDPFEGERGALAYAELNLDALMSVEAGEWRVISPSQHPALMRDLALVVSLDAPAGEIVRLIKSLGGENLAEVGVFDQYTGESLPPREIEGKTVPVKNLAFKLRFQRSDRTLTGEEVDRAIFRVLSGTFEEFGAVLRNYEQVKSDTVLTDPGLWNELLALYRG